MRSIAQVKDACDQLEKGGIEITIPQVSALCVSKYGGPKAQAIRNRESDGSENNLKLYIEARRAEQSLPVSDAGNKFKPNFGDPNQIKEYITLLEAELAMEKKSRKRILAAVREMDGRTINDLIGDARKKQKCDTVCTPADDNELRAVQEGLNRLFRFIDEVLLGDILEDDGGMLINKNTGAIILEKKEQQSLRELANTKHGRQ